MTLHRCNIFQISAFALILLSSGCQRRTIGSTVEPAQLSIQELATVLGVNPFCAETHYSSPCYSRLVITTTDSNGKRWEEISLPSPDTDFRIRILNICDPQATSTTQRINCAIMAKNRGSSEERYIHISPGFIFNGSTSNNINAFLYQISLIKGTEIRTIHIELETSAVPFPKSTSLK